jgi:hypothetical protein
MVLLVDPVLAVVEVWWWDPFGAAVFAFSGHRDGAVAAAAYQGIFAAYLQLKGSFGPVTVRSQYGYGTGPNRPQAPGRRRGDATARSVGGL